MLGLEYGTSGCQTDFPRRGIQTRLLWIDVRERGMEGSSWEAQGKWKRET